MDIPSVYWIVGLMLVGAMILHILKHPINKLLSVFRERAPLVKKYWLFVTPLLIATAASYILAYFYANNDIAFGLIGQVSSLVLGVIAGYIAFAELGESRFEKLRDSGMEDFQNKRFKIAKIKLEETHRIKPSDTLSLLNLMELYIILELYDEFDSKVQYCQKIIIEDDEELTLLYLIALKEVAQDHPRDAKARVGDVVDFVSTHQRARGTVGLSADEFEGSDGYGALSEESKSLAQNLLKFTIRKLDEESEARFIEGDYLLAPRVS